MTFEDKIYYERKDATLNATIQCIYNLLEDYGPISDELANRLSNEKNINILTKWLKLAAKADSIEEFTKAISEQDS